MFKEPRARYTIARQEAGAGFMCSTRAHSLTEQLMHRPFALPFQSAPETQPRASVSRSPLRLWLVWLIGTAVTSLPLLVAPLPPLRQHFFNLVRVEILVDPAAYARDFVVHWDAIPDLAMDLAVPWMAKFISVEDAAQIFLFVTLALLTSGTLMLSRVVNGRWSVLPLLSFLFLYNWILIRGFENNLFGLGLSLWALAAHISLRRSVAIRVLVSSFSAVIIYFCHLFPLGVFALVVGTWELGCLFQEGMTGRRVLGHAAAALVPFLLPALLLWSSSTGGLGGAIVFGISKPWTKIKVCIEALTVGNRVGDAALLASISMAAVLAAARGWLTVKPELRVTVIALPLTAVFFAPFEAFASQGIIERCGVSFGFLLVALLDLRPVDFRLQRLVAGALALVFLIRIGTVTADWRAAEGIIQAYRSAFASLEPGSVMLQVSQDVEDTSPLSAPHLWNPPLGSIVALATLNGVFVPEFYLKPGQQPVLYRDKDQSLRAYQYYDTDRRNVRYADDAVLRAWVTELHERFPDLQSRFTAVYIAVWDPGRRLSKSLPGGELVATLPEHRIYKLAPS